MMIQEVATGAYARWLMNHPGRSCPTYIEDLSIYLDVDEPRDPWGTRLEMVCEPPGAPFGVVSAGSDMTFRTADDIHSWGSGP